MNLQQAKQILGASSQDEIRDIKVKYHNLIGKHHPDAVGEASPEHIRRAQEINEAYKLLKKELTRVAKRKKVNTVWKGKENPRAFTKRNIYMHYHIEEEGTYFYEVLVSGKYMWDPEDEEFSLFLMSLNHASKELLINIEETAQCYTEENGLFYDESPELQELRFHYQISLFHLLAQEFINPVECLQRLANPVKVDTEGRAIYQFKAFIGAGGDKELDRQIKKLEPGTKIVPVSLQNNRILVADEQDNKLGYLSLAEDALYFCLIPLLLAKEAKLKMQIKEILYNQHPRTYQTKAQIRMLFRVERIFEERMETCKTEQIQAVLQEYGKKICTLKH